MDSDDDMLYDEEEDESMEGGSDDDHMDMVMEPEVSSTTYDTQDEEFPHQVLTPDMIVQHMIDCIKEVNTVVEISIRMSLCGVWDHHDKS